MFKKVVFGTLFISVLFASNNTIYKEEKCVDILMGNNKYNPNKLYDRTCLTSFVTNNINQSILKNKIKTKLGNLERITTAGDILIYNYQINNDKEWKNINKDLLIKKVCNNIKIVNNLLNNNISIKYRYKFDGKNKDILIKRENCNN